jgi:hypothetical protein
MYFLLVSVMVVIAQLSKKKWTHVVLKTTDSFIGACSEFFIITLQRSQLHFNFLDYYYY